MCSSDLMAINIGSMFAPITATKVTDLFLDKAGFSYVPQIPSLAHQYLDGNISADALSKFEALAVRQGYAIDNLSAFSNDYINTLSKAYNYGFGVACISDDYVIKLFRLAELLARVRV